MNNNSSVTSGLISLIKDEKTKEALLEIERLPVEALIKRTGKSGHTPIIQAIKSRNKDVILSLVEKVPIDELLKDDPYILHTICNLRYDNIVSKLLEKLPIEALLKKDYEGETPLHIACNIGNLPIVESILEKLITNPDVLTANLDSISNRNDTPFMCTCQGDYYSDGAKKNNDYVKIIKLLLRHLSEQQIKFRNKVGLNAFMKTCIFGFYDGMITFFDKLNMGDINVKTSGGASGFALACEIRYDGLKQKYYEIIKFLIDKIPVEELYFQNIDKNTPLHILCFNRLIDNTNIIKFILDTNKIPQDKLNIKNIKEDAPIDRAFELRNKGIVVDFIKAFDEKNIMYRDKNNNTLLHNIVLLGDTPNDNILLAVQKILDIMPIDMIDEPTKEGFTALDTALKVSGEKGSTYDLRIIEAIIKKLRASQMPIKNIEIFPEKIKNLVHNSDLGGSTGAKLYKNTKDNKWVVKTGSNKAGYQQVYYESVANDIYQAFGIDVPAHKLYRDNDSMKLVLQYIQGNLLNTYYKAKKLKPKLSAIKTKLCEGFIIDALLANWDVIGRRMDNIVVKEVGKESEPVRIDNGGSFFYRAQGEEKEYDDAVLEIFTMRDREIAPESAKIFQELKGSDILAQIREIILPQSTTEPPFKNIIKLIGDRNLRTIFNKRLNFLISILDIPTNISIKPVTDIDISVRTNIEIKKYSNIIKPVDKSIYSILELSALYKYTTPLGFALYTKLLYSKKAYGENAGAGAGAGANNIDNYNNNNYINIDNYNNSNYYFSYKAPKADITSFINLYISPESRNKKMLESFYHISYLYNIFQKAPKQTNEPFVLFRGTKSWYLDKSTERFGYINTFQSTTYDINVAYKFGNVPAKNRNKPRIKNVYIFYIHPECKYINISQISAFEVEGEILLPPYLRYMFIEEKFKDDYYYQKFVILPTDLSHTFEYDDFVLWKQSLIASKGGRANVATGLKNNIGIRTRKNNSLRPANLKPGVNLTRKNASLRPANLKPGVNLTRKNASLRPANLKPGVNLTRKNKNTNINIRNTRKIKVGPESIYSRFAEPIHTFQGKAPTDKEKAIIQKMKDYFA